MSKLHCWADRGECDEEWRWNVYLVDESEPGQTCFLEAGHEGPHRWTSDSDIVVSFPSAPSRKKARA